jgi:hypothetical protein
MLKIIKTTHQRATFLPACVQPLAGLDYKLGSTHQDTVVTPSELNTTVVYYLWALLIH